MSDVIPFYWLEAVAQHPETLPVDLIVAEALIMEGTTDQVAAPCPDCGGIETLDPQEVDESIEALIGLGFIESVVAVDCDCAAGGCESHLLVFRMPVVV